MDRFPIAVAALVFCLFATLSVDADGPTPDPLTGHYYEWITNFESWDEARVDARSRFFNGLPGHLATISDMRENRVVWQLAGGGINGWLGLTDSTDTSLLDGFDMSTLGTFEQGASGDLPLPADGVVPILGERGYGFVWLDGTPMTFQKWSGNGPTAEPNDGNGGNDGVTMTTSGGWNDDFAGVSLGQGVRDLRYTVEWDVVLSQQGFTVVERRPAETFMGDGMVVNLEEAKALLALPSGDPDIDTELSAEAFVLSFHDPELGGGLNLVTRSPFLSDTEASDGNFAFGATGKVVIPTAGDWTFALTHGEDVEIVVGGNSFSSTEGLLPTELPRLVRSGEGDLVVTPGGGGDVFHFPSAGEYEISVTLLCSTSFDFIQLFAIPGDVDTWDDTTFKLVGDILNGGLQVLEPSSLFTDGFESGDVTRWSGTN